VARGRRGRALESAISGHRRLRHGSRAELTV